MPLCLKCRYHQQKNNPAELLRQIPFTTHTHGGERRDGLHRGRLGNNKPQHIVSRSGAPPPDAGETARKTNANTFHLFT